MSGGEVLLNGKIFSGYAKYCKKKYCGITLFQQALHLLKTPRHWLNGANDIVSAGRDERANSWLYS